MSVTASELGYVLYHHLVNGVIPVSPPFHNPDAPMDQLISSTLMRNIYHLDFAQKYFLE
jgi:hypothetical protein